MSELARRDCDALLEHAGWVRALARHLTADAHTADDLAQDALVAALAHSPPEDRPLRGWLAGIVRNLARQARRSAGSRSARERAAARDTADRSSAQLLERLESHRAVVEAVARLDEPYRAAILMRYFEGLSPAAIATKTATPLRTIHTRLHRALGHLRTELDRAHAGDRRAWLLALIPFARGSKGWSTAALGTLAMDAKLKIALAAVVIVGVCSTIALWPSDSTGVPVESLAAAPSGGGVDVRKAPEPEPALEDTRALVEPVAQPSAAASASPAPAPAAPAKLAGRVIDVDGVKVPGVKVRYFDPKHGEQDGFEALTDANGAFELDDPRGSGHLDIVSPGWTSILRPEFFDTRKTREVVLVVARSVALAGIVVDERRTGLEAASLSVSLPFSLRSRFDTILDSSSTVDHDATTSADGHFELENVPLVAGATLVTTHATHLIDSRALPEHDDLALEIVLRSANEAPAHLVGTVVDQDGQPVEGAWVGLGVASTKSGASGAFALALDGIDNDPGGADTSSTPLRAVKQGFLPGELARPVGSAWPEPLILRLGGAPLTIAGRVIDADGQPVAKAEVWTDDETRFGYITIEGGEMSMRAGASVEGILRDDPWAPRVRTDTDGRFELHGLLTHDYSIHALDKKHLLAATAVAAAGARDVELRVPEAELYERVAGRVTSLSGIPIAGAAVVLERKAPGIRSSRISSLASFAVVTDADGLFEFQNVSRAIEVVGVSSANLGLSGFRQPIGAKDDVEHLELAVPVLVHVQIDAGAQPDFDKAALLDARGEQLELSIYHGKSSYSMQDVPLLDEPRTEPFAVSETAVTLVLYKKAVEVRRVPVKLVPGELNTLRP